VAEPLAFPPPHGSGVAFVTGSFGFLGRAAVSALDAAGWRVAAIGHPTRPWPGSKAWAEFAGGIEDRVLATAADAVGAPELIFHAAGGSSVGASVTDPQRDRRRNIGTLTAVLGFLQARAPDARLIYPSSAAVYGAAHPGPIPETAPLAPVSPYGAHKAEAEALIASAARDFGLQAVILRLFSIYGPGLRKQLLWELANRLASAPATVELAGSGQERRDFLFIDDALTLIGLAARVAVGKEPLILNGGSGRGASVREIAEGLTAAIGSPARIDFSGAVREGDPRNLVADISRAMALGFAPAVPLKAGLERTVAWFAGLPERSLM
jgi:UDP-glucose 4-epimerase